MSADKKISNEAETVADKALLKKAVHENMIDERGLFMKLDGNGLSDQATEYYLSDLKNDPWQQINIALQNRALVEAILEDQLNPKLEEIGDDWYMIPLTKESSYPGSN